MSRINRNLVKLSSFLPYEFAIRGARFFLATQGIGWATDVCDSGEIGATKIVIQNIKNPVIFDVGCNKGEYTSELLKLFPESEYYCIEPSRSHYEIIQNRFRSYKNISVYNIGFSNEASTMQLHKHEDVSGLATLLDRDLSYLGIRQDMHETVNLVEGAKFCKEHGLNKIDYLKIDVEGWEMPVLEGFEEMFTIGSIGACQFEFTSAQMERRENFRDFYRFFKRHDYCLYNIKPRGSIRKICNYEEILDSYFASNFLAILSK